ncbi:MAG: CBS domain-containing protein [Thermodesulfovibrionales bacterium]|nr:CBS domain-containing protein [Thermodesulfovibrionales bacterium]
MSSIKTVKEIMVDVFDYPHIPYWFTIRQAMGIIKKAFLETDKCFHHLAVLVFDEKYNLMGTLTLRHILKGLEPKLFGPELMTEYDGADIEQALANYEAAMFSEESKKIVEKPVSDIMIPAKVVVAPDDSVVKAAFMMVHHNIAILPVLEDRKKLVGLVRMLEVFKEVSSIVSE